ncbi:MAG: hypothetical protein IT323_14745, partial [Anaerolineae bacterium]|nr:hypothetical protein [Anaerolineae bacterium]
MSLHRRTVLTVTLSVVVLVIAAFVASQLIILGGFERLEQDAVASDLERAKRALAGEVAQLDSTAKDWAAWDDTYDFAAGANAGYVDENLGEDVFLNLRLSFLYYLNVDGSVVYAKAVDLESGVQAALPRGLEPWLTPGSPLTVFADVNSHIEGLVLLPEGPALISSRPILKNYGQGPIGGSLIAGRWLGDAETARLADQTQLSLAFVPIQDAALPADVAAITPILERDGAASRVLEGQRIAGYMLLKDILDVPALVMRIDMPRSVYAQGQSVLNYMVLALLLGGGIFGVQTIYQ